MKLTFVNHACCKVTAGNVGVLFDPWIDGSAFNDGWDLLVPTPLSLDAIMDSVTHIWISHEHPDHFSPPFLARIAQAHKERVTILFQATRDGRVVKFCRGLGFRVLELADGKATALGGGVTAICGRFDFYDSWLALSDGAQTLLNLNDCAMRGADDLARVAFLVGRPAVLLTQFSYAAWKGGRANRDFRDAAAGQKRETLKAQVASLKPRFAIPFASMIYFSNVENAYLNDAMNTPRVAADVLGQAGASPVVLYPGDDWEIGAPHDNTAVLARYDARYAALAQLPLRATGASVDIAQMQEAFLHYRKRVFERNSRLMIRFLATLPALGAFRPLNIRLDDLDTLISFSLLDGIAVLPSGAARANETDVTMHSSSLLFVLQNEFGYDTLTVNGRFEATGEGFSKMTRALSIGSLNAMGLSISPSLFFNARVVLILLRRLRGVLARMKTRDTATA